MVNELVIMNEPESRIHIAIDGGGRAGNLCEFHYHDEIELILLLDGHLEIVTEDTTYTVNAGQIVFVDSRVPHYTYSQDGVFNYILLQFGRQKLAKDSAILNLASFISMYSSPVTVFTDPVVECSMTKLLDEFTSKREGYLYFIRSEIYAITGHLIRKGYLKNSDSISDRAVDKIIPALEYIDENFAQCMTLDEVSNIVGLNPSYFCRLFKNTTGATFTEYLNFVRVSKSEALLNETTKSITEISIDVGFSSASYYNRVFKHFKNCTPSTYRTIRPSGK